MHWKKLALAIICSLVVFPAVPTSAQIAPAATQSGLPLKVGVGVSDYYLDWGPSRYEMGISAWADWTILRLPRPLDGLGIEVEGRSIFFNAPSVVSGHRMDTGEGGPIYQWRRYDRVQPYAKYLFGFGSIDFPPVPPKPTTSNHTTSTLLVPGAGVDVHVWKNISVRADYEYQHWRQIFGSNDLTPNGITVGAAYDFHRCTTRFSRPRGER